MSKLRDWFWSARFTLRLWRQERVPAAFFCNNGQWWALIHGVRIQVEQPFAESLEYYRHFVPQLGELVFDIGGERGIETAQLSGLVGSTGQVVVCECMPGHAENLRKMAQSRGNIMVVPSACWNEETELEFFLGCTAGSHTAVQATRGQRGQLLADVTQPSIKVKAETLDAIWQRVGGGRDVGFMKMDIEGAEYEALAGAQEVLNHTKKVVVAAYHLRDGQPTAERVGQMLSDSGFKVRIDRNLHVYGVRPS